MSELLSFGMIEVSGVDAEKFLQGQATCDLKLINSTQSQLGAFCNLKGRVVASFRLFYFAGNYYLQLPTNMVEITLSHLKKYSLFSKVKLHDVSQQWQQIGVRGKINADIVAAYPDVFCFSVDHDRSQIIGGATVLLRLMHNTLTQLNFIDEDHWHLADINTGIATIYPQTSQLFTPHMLNYPELNAVSFNKGCYLGQEIIARTQYLGKSKRNLIATKIQSLIAPQPGDKLVNQNQNETGAIVDAISIATDQYQALIMINDANYEKVFFNNNVMQL